MALISVALAVATLAAAAAAAAAMAPLPPLEVNVSLLILCPSECTLALMAVWLSDPPADQDCLVTVVVSVLDPPLAKAVVLVEVEVETCPALFEAP